MRSTNTVMTIAAGMLLAAWGKQEAPAPAAPIKLGETPSMKTPESARYDADLDVFFVSNINGNPSQHDGNGFIAVVRADSISVVIRSTLLQLLTPAEMLGRVSAVNSVFIGSSNELGAFESGVAARLFGTVPAVVAGGFAALAVVVLTARVVPTLRRLERIV